MLLFIIDVRTVGLHRFDEAKCVTMYIFTEMWLYSTMLHNNIDEYNGDGTGGFKESGRPADPVFNLQPFLRYFRNINTST